MDKKPRKRIKVKGIKVLIRDNKYKKPHLQFVKPKEEE
jgi:hypothetical protein